MYLKLFVLSVLISNVFCDTGYSYQLPDSAEHKSLNVTIGTEPYQQFQITIECYNFDSLKHFEIRLGQSTRLQLRNGVVLNFIKCFNNATDHENYNYELSRWFNSLPYFINEQSNGYPIIIKLDAYAKVNSDVLFKYFDFRKFNSVTLINLGLASTQFLNHISCRRCKFDNNGVIDFDHFSNTIAETENLDLYRTKLTNINRSNLRKFIGLVVLNIFNFDLDDYNAFNVADLFEHNTNIKKIEVINSKAKITLHEHTFRGLNKLQTLRLERVQLDFIPKDLFKNLEQLSSVDFSTNNIKSIDPATFQSTNQLSYVSFSDNPFYTEPHNKLETLHMNGSRIRLYLGNFTEHTFDLLEQLIQKPHLQVKFQSFQLDHFNVTEFTKLYRQHQNSTLDVHFYNGEPALDLENVKSFGNIIRSQDTLPDPSSATIRIQFSDAMCHDCTMVKYLYPYFINDYRQNPGFYFEESRLFIKFEMPTSCYYLNEHFEESFDDNCPVNCACKYNSVVDRIKINCANKNLTEIPIIPYPEQFDKLHSIYLNFANNSLSVLSLANQDVNVRKKLAMLNFKNNNIKRIEIDEEDLSKNIFGLNLCENPVLPISVHMNVPLNLASGSTSFNKFRCATYEDYLIVEDYIRDYKSSELGEYLNGLKCN